MDGNTLTWQVTVEDPMSAKRWVMDAVTARSIPIPRPSRRKRLACSERDGPHMASKDDH